MNSGHFLFDSSGHGNILVLGNGDQVYQGPIRSVFNIEEPSKRRIFFSSQDELYDDEFYDEQLPEKKRRLTSDQILFLEKSFEAENKLEPDRKTQLARNLGLQPRQVAVWFQNRRARWKTKQLEREFDLLKASYNSLLSDIDLAVKENEKLKSEVESLTEKLQVKELAGMVVVGQKFNPQLSSDETTINSVVAAAEFNVKAENHLSSATVGSVVVDEDGPQLVDSGDSYFPEDDVYNGYNVGPINDIVHYEDDGGSDDNERYWVVEHHQEEETETLNWWIWP